MVCAGRSASFVVPPGHHVLMVGGSSSRFRLKPGLRTFRSACLLLALPAALLCGCSVRSTSDKDAPQVVSTTGAIEMVALPGGWFEMGAADADEPDQRLHKVFVSPFAMDKYPVTQQEYEKQMGVNPSHWKGPQNPVEQIRWLDAAAYCNARSRAEGLQARLRSQDVAVRFPVRRLPLAHGSRV